MKTEPVPPNNTLSALTRAAGLILMFICTAVLFFEVFTVFWSFGTIWSNIGSGHVGILILAPSPCVLTRITGAAAEMYYLFIVASVIVSFVVLLYTSRDGIRNILQRKKVRVYDIPLYGVVTLFAADISFNIIFNAAIMASGGTPTVPEPSGPIWTEWFSYMNAAVWEEILCRVLMIGLPMAAVGLMTGERGSWKRLFGRFDADRAAVVFILVSASLFAYGHLDGWDVYKLIPTFVGGLALGYLFVRYGIHAAIMLHFLINYLSSFTWVLGDVTGTAITALFILTVVLLGTVFFVRYTIRGLEHLKKMMSKQ